MWQQVQGWLTFAFLVLAASMQAVWLLANRTSLQGNKNVSQNDSDHALLLSSEILRKERAEFVDKQFDDLREEIRGLRKKTSEDDDDSQDKIGRFEISLVKLHGKVEGHERRLTDIEYWKTHGKG